MVVWQRSYDLDVIRRSKPQFSFDAHMKNPDRQQQATMVLSVPLCGSMVLASRELLLLCEYYKKSKYFKTL
jgi:hypothetical protein